MLICRHFYFCLWEKNIQVFWDFLPIANAFFFVFIIFSLSRDASMMVMRRRIQGLSAEQIKNLPKEELDFPVTMDDFTEALTKVSKSVSEEDIKKYVQWMNEFGSV